MMIAFIERFVIALERLAAAHQELARKTPELWNFTGTIPSSSLYPPVVNVPASTFPEPSTGGSY